MGEAVSHFSYDRTPGIGIVVQGGEGFPGVRGHLVEAVPQPGLVAVLKLGAEPVSVLLGDSSDQPANELLVLVFRFDLMREPQPMESLGGGDVIVDSLLR